MPRPGENCGSMSFRWMSEHPGAVLLRRAQNLPVYVLRPDGALKQYSDGPMSARVRGYPREPGERHVTT